MQWPGRKGRTAPALPCRVVLTTQAHEPSRKGVSMSIRRIDVGPRMSQIVIHGNTVYLAGQVGEGDTVAAQTLDILKTIDELLAKAGTDKTKILQAIIWLSDMSSFDEMNKEWEAWVPQGHTPARATG